MVMVIPVGCKERGGESSGDGGDESGYGLWHFDPRLLS